MLQVPKLDDLDYEQLINRARSRIPQYTGEWTDLNHHDPGITTLQTMAWLVDNLNYYMDATGEAHKLAYLRLLGIEPQASPAKCVLALEADMGGIHLPPGTGVAAGDTVFEIPQGYRGTANRLVALFNQVEDALVDLTPFAGVDEGFARVFTEDKQKSASLYFGFQYPMEEQASLYVEVSGAHGRNPFHQAMEPPLARLVWEYYDGEDWKPAELLRDDTCGFLRSGAVELRLWGKTDRLHHLQLKSAHYLRAVLVENRYDMLPELGRIQTNWVEAVQTRTVAKTLELPWKGEKSISIPHCVRENDLVMVSVGREGDYDVWYRFVEQEQSLCRVDRGGRPWERVVTFHKKKPAAGSSILVTLMDSRFQDRLVLGRTDGCANLCLPVDLEEAWSLRVGLFQQQEQGDALPSFQLWEPCAHMGTAGCGDRVFAYHRTNNQVEFGDAITGRQPPAGKLVVVLDATTSRLGEGNVRKGQANRFLADVGEVGVANMDDSVGGRSPRSAQELEQEIAKKLDATTRAVNPEDYVGLVMETPGLMIDMVNLVSRRDYDRCYGTSHSPNTVFVVVKPHATRTRPELSDTYRKIIEAHLEGYRLLTTNIQVISPRYGGISVNGRIQLRENAPWAREQVEQTLEELIDFRHVRRFGGRVEYGTIFSRLELLEGVSGVAELSLGHSAGCCEKNSQGDVLLYPDTLPWLEEINIEYS